jgi:hypothetical protein
MLKGIWHACPITSFWRPMKQILNGSIPKLSIGRIQGIPGTTAPLVWKRNGEKPNQYVFPGWIAAFVSISKLSQPSCIEWIMA